MRKVYQNAVAISFRPFRLANYPALGLAAAIGWFSVAPASGSEPTPASRNGLESVLRINAAPASDNAEANPSDAAPEAVQEDFEWDQQEGVEGGGVVDDATTGEPPAGNDAEDQAPAEQSQPEAAAEPYAMADDEGLVVTAESNESASDEAPAAQTAKFHGITPGASTKTELMAGWGTPEDSRAAGGGEVLHYALPPFAGVDVLVQEGVVQLIKVALAKQEDPSQLAAKLRVEDFEAVEIINSDSRELLGLAIPEKGMLFLLAQGSTDLSPNAPQFVSHLVVQPLDSEAFTLRVEGRQANQLELNRRDLLQALAIDPDHAHANWLLAEIQLSIGDVATAESTAAKAIAADPTNDAYRLRWAECLSALARYDQSVLETRKVLDSETAPEIVRAQALHVMGLLASVGDAEIAQKAAAFHTMAIEAADKLATSNDDMERRLAKRVLVDAHLAVAEEISRRDYASKTDVIAQWIGRASGFAEEAIASGDGDLSLRLEVAVESLATLANIKPTKDPAPWIKEAEETASTLLADCNDDLTRANLLWRMGEAYFYALRTEHTRGDAEQAIKYAELAMDRLASGGETRVNAPDSQRLVGRLYFHLGAAYAVHKQDHKSAVEFYERARQLLNRPRAGSELAVPRREGESLVSMGVSYWEQGQRALAMELTQQGASLMERAVEAGVLNGDALVVPYANLSTMFDQMGDVAESTRYAQLASGSVTTRSAAGSTTPNAPEPTNVAAKRSSSGDAPNLRSYLPDEPHTASRTTPPEPDGRGASGSSQNGRWRSGFGRSIFR